MIKTRKKKLYLFFFFGLVILSICFYLLPRLCSFLSISTNTDNTSGGVLVVEGWLPEDALEQAKEIFLKNNYHLLLTTGFPYYKGILMGSNGEMNFEVKGKVTASKDNLYSIILSIRGSKANGKFAHFLVYADSNCIGEDYSTRRKMGFRYQAELPSPPDHIRVIFDNDDFRNNRDRNLFLYSVQINDQIFPVNNESVCYFRKRNGVQYLYRRLGQNSADFSANFFTGAGIPDSLVIPLVTQAKKNSKTLGSAMEVQQWIHVHNEYEHHPITVLSQGFHSHRSWLSFKKVFGDSVEINIISLDDQKICCANWWKTYAGRKTFLYEAVELFYVYLFI